MHLPLLPLWDPQIHTAFMRVSALLSWLASLDPRPHPIHLQCIKPNRHHALKADSVQPWSVCSLWLLKQSCLLFFMFTTSFVPQICLCLLLVTWTANLCMDLGDIRLKLNQCATVWILTFFCVVCFACYTSCSAFSSSLCHFKTWW